MEPSKNLKGLDLRELMDFVEGVGERKYRARQLYGWLYAKGEQSFEEMTDISKECRSVLSRTAVVSNLINRSRAVSSDGTTKILYGLEDGKSIESVLIPPAGSRSGEDKRLTLCVSTQVGCPLACVFCATGSMGFTRNLTAGEIVDQVIQTQKETDTYVIDQIRIVDPTEVSVLRPRSRPSVTLVTCYPFYFVGDAPQRYIVQASLVSADKKSLTTSDDAEF